MKQALRPITNIEKALPMLREKREVYHSARNDFYAAVLKAFPVGSRFRFRTITGGKVKVGEVVAHGEDGRVQIKSVGTEAVYWRNPDHLMLETDGALIGDE
jgi:hypothetical protein